MTIVNGAGFGKAARVLHAGKLEAYTVRTAETTTVASAVYSKTAPINNLTAERYKPNAATWTYEIELTGDNTEVDCLCLAAHTLGSTGCTVTLSRYSDGDYATINTVSPTDNSPIMFLFGDTDLPVYEETQPELYLDFTTETYASPFTSKRFRLSVTGGAAELGILRIGNSLQMERPFYGNYTPARMNRKSDIIGNRSERGELLGRSIIRTTLTGDYKWNNLTYAWVRTNLDTPAGLIQSVEINPLFLAWRPSLTQDVDFIMIANTTPPQTTGIRDLMSFSLSGEVYSYE